MSLRPAKSMHLNVLTREAHFVNTEEDKHIDFSAAGLYLPAAQTVFATTASAAVSVLACWVFPAGSISAVRTLALTMCAGVAIIRRPVKIGNTKGVNTIFSALRPCSFLYVACLVLEQLVHTCVSETPNYDAGHWRRIVYHVSMAVLTISAFVRSKNPRSEDGDVPILVSMVALLVIALLPPPAVILSGPLCSPPTLPEAGERMLRAFLFSCVYVVLVYSSAPISNNLADSVVCVTRSATSSSWVLGVIVYALPLAALQVCLILYFSFRKSSTEYEGVSDVEQGQHLDASTSRMSPEGSVSGAMDENIDIVAAAAALTRKSKDALDPPGGALSFKLSLPASMTCENQQQRMAEIASSM